MGNITQVTVSDPSFPIGYDQTQFDLCLDVPVLKDNLNSICEKVDDDDLQKIILKKLNEVNYVYVESDCLLSMRHITFIARQCADRMNTEDILTVCHKRLGILQYVPTRVIGIY